MLDLGLHDIIAFDGFGDSTHVLPKRANVLS
jgi:hypothetical protein